MSDNKERKVKIYTIHSQKGGVGKSSIALAIAGLEEIIEKKKILIMDSDFTGTTLVDLPGWTNKDSKIKYSNEFLSCSPQDFIKFKEHQFKDFFQPVPQEKDIEYCPASPCWEDISLISDLTSQEEYLGFLSFRLLDVLGVLSKIYDVIIFDNPPGLHGLSYAIYKLVMGLKEHLDIDMEKHFIFVTTGDSVDYKALLPSMNWLSRKMKKDTSFKFFESADIILNKVDRYLDVPRWMKIVTEELREGFIDKRRILDKQFITDFREKYTQRVLPISRFVPDFRMENIIKDIRFISNKYPTKEDWIRPQLPGEQVEYKIINWCLDIGKAVWSK